MKTFGNCSGFIFLDDDHLEMDRSGVGKTGYDLSTGSKLGRQHHLERETSSKQNNESHRKSLKMSEVVWGVFY